MTASALYEGTVEHRRSRPRRHALKYRIFMMLLDLEEIPDLSRRLRLLSHRRFNLFGFDERDHADGSGGSLRVWVETHLADAAIDLEGGAIRLLAMPRVLGYCFNPISVYFCHHRDGTLKALLYEVHNTFGERHSYLIPVAPGGPREISQSCDKSFHVSPFMAMGLRYQFRIRPPDGRFGLTIQVADADGPMMTASFQARRVTLTDAALVRALVRTPLPALTVIGGIYWEALRLWWKGLRVHPHPPPPPEPVSVVQIDNIA